MSLSESANLPRHWHAISLRYAAECLDGGRVPLNSEERASRRGEYPYWGANGIVDYVNDYLFDEPLVLLGEDGAPFFDKTKPISFSVNGKIWVNNHIHVLRIRRDFDQKFITYCLNSTDYGPWIEGSTRDKLTQDKMGSISLPVPPLVEQRAIADFLDHETAKIDELISGKKRLIELLAEKRRALITHAVTRGLDPDVPMRDSGVEWLGEIPRHWGKQFARWLFGEVDERSNTGEGELLTVSHLTGVTLRSEKEVNMFMAETLEGYKICRPGDLVINTLWAWMGAMGVAFQHGLVSPAYNVYRSLGQLEPRFVDYLVRIPIFAQEVTRYSKGVWSSRLRLYPEEFFQVVLPVPPAEEQRAIIDSLDRETEKMDSLNATTQATIKLLRERRAALISAAVTGQLSPGVEP